MSTANKRKRVPKCANCLVNNPSHDYKNCPEPCRICQSQDHKTRSCPQYAKKNKKRKTSGDNDQDVLTSNISSSSTSSSTLNPSSPTSTNREFIEIENILSENGVFSLSAMTSAATFPSSHLKSIELTKHQVKFKTTNGFEGTINLHTNEDEVRSLREGFQSVNVNFVNQNNNITNDGDIEYSIEINKKSPRGQPDKLKRVGAYLSQAKYYQEVFPEKIPLRKTDISPADWRVEKYVSWERRKISDPFEEMAFQEEEKSTSARISGSIFDDPPDANAVVNSWKKGKAKVTYYFNPPLVPELTEQDNDIVLLTDYIEYMSEGLKYVQYNNEINRRSELRYCSYLDKAIEVFREKTQNSTSKRMTSEILKSFFSQDDNNDKDRAYLNKKKMVGKRLNKLMLQCQLNWSIIDCVEELSVNFLTNTVQEENFNTFIEEINKDYSPQYLSRTSTNQKKSAQSEFDKLLEGSQARLAEIQKLKLSEIEEHMKVDQSYKLSAEDIDKYKDEFNNFEFDIAADEDKLRGIAEELAGEDYEKVIDIIDQRRELLSRLEVILENLDKRIGII
jgi:hypothetical protein